MNRTTEEMRLALLRERLKEKCENGLLGTVAARAAVAEGTLFDWCNDSRKVPTLSEIEDVSKVIAREHYEDAALQSAQMELLEDAPGGDPYNSVGARFPGFGDPLDKHLPLFLRRQAG